MAKLSDLQPIEFIAERIPANYPRSFNHIGDHIRAKRLESGIQMQEAAKLIGTYPGTLKNWERKYFKEPGIQHWPKITAFLGYCPLVSCPTFPEKISMWRKMNGFSIQEIAVAIGIDPGTYSRFESGVQVTKRSREAIGKFMTERLSIC